MSPRARTPEPASVCSWRACKRPTRDHALVCDGCLDELAVGLRDLLPTSSDRPEILLTAKVTPRGLISWCDWPRPREVVPGLWDELQATIVGERAIDYGSSSGGGSGERGVVSVGLVLPETASDVAELLRLWLRHLVRLAVEFRLDHNASPEWVSRFPQESVPGMAEWLAWRVDSMCWNPEVADAAGAVHRFIGQATWAVNRPAARQQLGDCPAQGCSGHLSSVQGSPFATCSVDRTHHVEAQPLRDRIIDDHEDSLYTAAEIAKVSTYLGLRAGRKQVADRIRQWSHRELIRPVDYRRSSSAAPLVLGPLCESRTRCDHQSCAEVRESRGAPVYRFGSVYPRLLASLGRPDIDEDFDSPASKGA